MLESCLEWANRDFRVHFLRPTSISFMKIVKSVSCIFTMGTKTNKLGISSFSWIGNFGLGLV